MLCLICSKLSTKTPEINSYTLFSLHKKWSFSLRVSSVNVTKSPVSYGFGHIYWKKSFMKNFFFCSVFAVLLQHKEHDIQHNNLILSSLTSTMYFPIGWRLCKTLDSCTFQLHMRSCPEAYWEPSETSMKKLFCKNS